MEWNGIHVLKAVTTPAERAASSRAAPQPSRPARSAPRVLRPPRSHRAESPPAQEERRHARAEAAEPSLRPLTDGMVTLAGLLDRYEQLRTELAAVADHPADVCLGAVTCGAQPIWSYD